MGLSSAELDAMYEEFSASVEAKAQRVDVPEDPNARREFAKKGLIEFGLTYLPHYFELPSPRFHHELAQIALDVALVQGEYASHLGFVCAAPRDHSKSTIVSLLLILYCCVYRIKHFIIIISDTDEPQAKTIASNIKQEFEENVLLRQDFGEMRGESYGLNWAVQDFDVVSADDGVVAHRTRILSRGIGSKIRGLREGSHRPDLIVLDDVENDENIETDIQRNKIWLWFNKALMPMLDHRVGRVLIVGTVMHQDSLLKKLLSLAETGTSEYIGRMWNAIDKQGNILWPEKYSLARLMQIKARNPFAFNTEYMNEPIDEQTRVIRPEWIQWYTAEDIGYNPDDHSWTFRGVPLTIDAFCDPNLTEREQGDDAAIVVGGITREKDLVILYTYSGHIDFSAQVNTIIEVANYWRVRRFGIEANHYQRALADQVKTELRTHARISPRRSYGRKFDRIKGASPVFSHGKVYLRAALDREEGEADELQRVRVHHTQFKYYQDLIYYPATKHDDLIDCTERLIDMSGGYAAFAPGSWG